MIQKIYLINSANFSFLDLSLQKDLFFLGDNGSGKTTVIRAIHYLFSADVRNLGIPTDKEGFKEYYFRYSNSYIVYVFEEFFIFMYKSGGEIVKVFSKQPFALERIMDEDRQLYELEAIKRYLKEAPLKKTVKSMSEYRDIVYGHDKRYLDFMFAPIKNSDIFLGLFNEIFNIDKSIIDAKSIKKAIQTTLDYEKKVIDFNHEEYLQKIYEFQSGYRFFKEFEKHKETIESAYGLKEKLLGMEEHLFALRGAISFRLEREKQELFALTHALESNEMGLKKSIEFYKIKEKTLAKWEERYKRFANALALEIETIKRLKEKFNAQALLDNGAKADRFEQIETTQIRLSEELIKLEQGFANERESIDKEIEALKHKRDKELPREFEGKLFSQEQNLKISLQEKIQDKELQFEQKEKQAHYESADLEAEIQGFESSIKKEKLLVQNLLIEQKKELENLRSAFEKQLSELKNKEFQTHEEIGQTKVAIREKEYARQEAERALKIQKEELEQSFAKELHAIEEQRVLYASMVEAKAGSFKEFLHEEVDGWERELYPVMDASLLDRSVAELQPRLLDGRRVFGMELNTQGLKTILTKEEANQKLEALTLSQEVLENSYKESLERLQKEFDARFESLAEQKVFLAQTLQELEAKIVALHGETQTLHAKQTEQTKELKNLHAKREREHLQTMANLQEEITNNRELIGKIHKALREQRRKISQEIEEFGEEFKEALRKQKEVLKKELLAQQEKLTHAIALQEEKKQTISKDERIVELQEAIARTRQEYQESMQSRNFLAEYEKERERLETLVHKQNDLQSAALQNREFTKRLDAKIEHYQERKEELLEEKKELLEKQKILKKGLERFERYEGGFELCEPRESGEYLEKLLREFDEVDAEYKNKKVDLKTKLDKLNSLKNMQNEIEISFGFEEYVAHPYISQSPNILLKLEEIVEFKNKKLEMLKQSGHKKFLNFIQNLLPQKMSVFSDSEDKFLSQVQRINKNLGAIDFGVIKEIRIDTKSGDKKSVAKLLEELREVVGSLSSLLGENSLFYDKEDVYRALETLEAKFKEIKAELKGSAISLQDTIDLSLSFNENGKIVSNVVQLKNESSTGGSMLLKIALAIAILQLFIEEEKTPFFLIVDEVSRLHSANQERLRDFANTKGFKIVFVTPEPTYSKPESIKYYRFRKNSDDEFEAIELNL
ncbi:MAG: ATP-binding protein [Sulfurimonadaceae bacterium]